MNSEILYSDMGYLCFAFDPRHRGVPEDSFYSTLEQTVNNGVWNFHKYSPFHDPL